MPGLSRRRFLASSAAAAGVVVLGGRTNPASAITPRDLVPAPKYGDLRDIQHVVILMQENRSFDHYFGMLRGVRGFGDRSTITLPNGNSVFQQPTSDPGASVPTSQFPYRLSDTPPSSYPSDNQPADSQIGSQAYSGTSHNWDDQHGAWAGGWMDGWVRAKSRLVTLGYLDRDDIPFHYALADAYTVGDAYHCSVFSSTGPNRTFLWSGTIDAQKRFSHFTAFQGGDERGKRLLWTTYAETLQAAGVSWKMYQCRDQFSNNALEYFASFAALDPSQNGQASPGNPLYDRGITTVPEPLTGKTANADNLNAAIRSDVVNGTLPQVSWVVTNKVFSEHPDGTPTDGAYFIKGLLDALNADPNVFNSTLVMLMYDENDGQFDHVPPPVPPRREPDEWFREPRGNGYLSTDGPAATMPVGLGFRVPLILISPWTRGGWVTSEVADHTSIIQFLEKWTAAIGLSAACPNISSWRRRVCGDLTNALDFSAPVYGLPDLPGVTPIGEQPGTGYQPMPTTNQMPVQEPGTKRAKPLPYQPNVDLKGIGYADDGTMHAHFFMSNNAPHATRSCHFAVYNNMALNPIFQQYPAYAPKQFTIEPQQRDTGQSVIEGVNLGEVANEGAYDITVLGPNRFMRRFVGNVFSGDTTSRVHVNYYPNGPAKRPVLQFNLINRSASAVVFSIQAKNYSSGTKRIRVPSAGHVLHEVSPLHTSHGWYDYTIRVSSDSGWSQRYVGHLETGKPSISGS